MTTSPSTGGGEGQRPLLEVLRLGRKPFAEVHELQKRLLEERIADKICDTLILVEHDPVITVGRGTRAGGVPDPGVPVVAVERGGEATYHGPGQVVAYPIYRLPENRRDVHRYLRDLEEVVIRALAEVEIEGRREPGRTGVWIGERKVASVGVAVRRWVTWHGLALNVHTDLEAFQGLRPCGMDPGTMTRVVDHADVPPANLLFEVLIVKHFLDVFALELPASGPRGSEGGGTEDEGGGRFPALPILG